MSIRVTCLWCGVKNDITKARMNNLAIYCRHCGHRADKAQTRCDCRQCIHPVEEPTDTSREPQQGELFKVNSDDDSVSP
ncbi:MAG: hypothetical protein HOP19_07440 [Acidobacteria bacterium]|nr:hypothetical protein [Acidobacteriota bacterium]